MYNYREEILDISLLDRLKQDIQNMNSDLRAEVLASGLIHNGVDPARIIIQPQGNAQRSYRKDVSAFYTQIADYDNKEYLYIKTHRDGFYDALPENIFHQPTRGRTEKNKEEAIDEIRKHREEEKAARKFFLAFEHEYYYVKTLLNIVEEDFEKNTSNSKLIRVFAEHWPVLKKLDTYHAYVFLRIIPLIHAIRNNFEMSSRSISLILGIPVEITLHHSCKINSSSFLFKLGDGRLGIDSAIGSVLYDGEHDLKVKIGPLTEKDLPLFLTGGKYENIIDELLGYFFGVNYLFHKEIIFDKTEQQFTLAKNKTSLGVNAFI